jgi:acyl carrier protein
VNANDAEKLIRLSLREVAPEADFDAVPRGADLRDTLHLDSLDFLQLVELLSERSGRRIDEEDYPRLATVASTVAFLTEA